MALPPELQAQLIKVLRDKKIFHTIGWSNYMKTVNNRAAVVVEVGNEKELQVVLQTIKALNAGKTDKDKITVRAAAGWSDDNVSSCCLLPWKKVQQNKYNEGFTFSQAVGGRPSASALGTDVIIRFAKKSHAMRVIGALPTPVLINPKSSLHQLPSTLIEVSAGVQVAELADFLRANKLSLSTVSMIAWVSAIGLMGTGGHGTGRDEPGFSGLIESMRICDMDGNIREISRGDPDFETLCGAHCGLLGVIISVKMRAVEAFNLRETITLFTNTGAMQGKLGRLLRDNQYLSIMGMPSYSANYKGPFVSKWQCRQWNHTVEKPTAVVPPPYAPDIVAYTQELQVRIGASVMEYLLDPDLKHLLPSFMLLSATMTIGVRGTTPLVDFENHITHPQVAFPQDMRDVSYQIPVKDQDAGEVLEKVLRQIEALSDAAGKRGECPITYAVYVRYFKGTNGGLSTTSTNASDERILAIDIVTHPEAPGITNFETAFLEFLHGEGIFPRNHLGKNFPVGICRYDQFLSEDSIETYLKALVRWHHSPGKQDGAARIAMSPFNTPYLQKMLSPSPTLANGKHPEEEVEPVEREPTQHTDQQRLDFLTKLHSDIAQQPHSNNEGRVAKEAFLSACSIEIENCKAKTQKPALV